MKNNNSLIRKYTQPNGVIYAYNTPTDKQTIFRKDIRLSIINELKKRKMYISDLAVEIDFNCSNLTAYLHYRRVIPHDVLERIFAFLSL